MIATVAFHGRMEDPEKAKQESEQETDQHWGAFHEDGTLMAIADTYGVSAAIIPQ